MNTWKRYLVVFVITLIIFSFTFWLSSVFSGKKIDELRDIQTRISMDILSTETRFSLLENAACEDGFVDSSIERTLSQELGGLARRVKFMESQLGSGDVDVVLLKKQYALLQIKDYLLVEQLDERCDLEVFTILYFHEGNCKDCSRQSIVLDALQDDHPEVRVYWFDKDLETPALLTLLSMFDVVKGPSMIINEELIEGFVSSEDLEGMLPERILELEEEVDVDIENEESEQ